MPFLILTLVLSVSIGGLGRGFRGRCLQRLRCTSDENQREGSFLTTCCCAYRERPLLIGAGSTFNVTHTRFCACLSVCLYLCVCMNQKEGVVRPSFWFFLIFRLFWIIAPWMRRERSTRGEFAWDTLRVCQIVGLVRQTWRSPRL
jgi:hypothetical protein